MLTVRTRVCVARFTAVLLTTTVCILSRYVFVCFLNGNVVNSEQTNTSRGGKSGNHPLTAVVGSHPIQEPLGAGE